MNRRKFLESIAMLGVVSMNETAEPTPPDAPSVEEERGTIDFNVEADLGVNYGDYAGHFTPDQLKKFLQLKEEKSQYAFEEACYLVSGCLDGITVEDTFCLLSIEYRDPDSGELVFVDQDEFF